METNPLKLPFGLWNEGWALDLHTSSSLPIKNEQGEIIGWDTTRSPIGEELYRLKYCKELHRAETIARVAAEFIKQTKWRIDLIIPMPPSDLTREFQPVYEMAKIIGRLIDLPVDFNSLKKVKLTSELKEIEEAEIRGQILKDAFDMETNAISGKNALIFDDIYRSGQTLNIACKVIIKKGNARRVYALTITKTRSKR